MYVARLIACTFYIDNYRLQLNISHTCSCTQVVVPGQQVTPLPVNFQTTSVPLRPQV